MLRGGAVFQSGFRWGALGLMAILGVGILAGTADARSRHHQVRRHHYVHHHYVRHRYVRHHRYVNRYDPPRSSIVVDVNSGKVLEASHADSLRHPASLTKMMTLYLLFERLQAGKIKLTTEMPVSAHAAAMAPTKIGLRPGQHLSVESAIKAIVTRSANDAAVVIAEEVGGTETAFARMMTAKAHQLGMMHTTYVNASGLPNPRQLTTARDQAIMARALQDRFPQYFHYFSTRVFDYHGEVMRNHNNLLGHVPGVDGIKTGFVYASGFNIAVDVRRDHHHIVVVVFGGRTARSRDELVKTLINNNIRISATRRTASLVVAGWKDKTQLTRAKPLSLTPPKPGSTAPIKPTPVRTVLVQPAKRVAMLTPLPPPARQLAPMPDDEAPVATVATVPRNPPLPPQVAIHWHRPATLSAQMARLEIARADIPASARNGWMIQVGAFDDEDEAKQRLVVARVKAKDQLGKADPFTERVAKGNKSFFRARFAGLDRTQARSACRHLKRSDIPCLMLKN